MNKQTKAFLLLALVFFCAPARAALSPVGISIFPPIQFPTSKTYITGVRVSALWGSHWKVYGIDLGAIGNITQQDIVGISVSGIFNANYGNISIFPLQVAGIANIGDGRVDIIGVQAAVAVNYIPKAGTITGLQVAVANLADHTNIRGVQVGIFNTADHVYGFQIGVVNQAESLHGIQLGLINMHKTGIFPIVPGINIGI